MTEQLVAFLKARLDEDERDAERLKASRQGAAIVPVGDGDPIVISGQRLIDDFQAKRRIVDFAAVVIANEHGIYERTSGDHQYNTLRLLALPYADHPDYREEWRP